MRIVGVEPFVVEVPLREPVHGVHGVTTVQRSVLVRVTGGDGVEGWGNVDPTPGYSAMSAAEVHDTVRRIGPALAGADPFNLHRALALMDRAAPGRYEAIAVVEMALVDLKARALGLPVHSLLGGRVKNEITFNAWIGAVPPGRAAREAAEWLDFNESLTRAEAVPFIRRLEPYGLTLVEQPIPRAEIDGLAEIRRGIGIPLMADESVSGPASIVEIIRREAADLVKVKVMKQGGLLRTLAMVECAAAAGLRVVIGHGFGLTLSTLAETTVAAVSAAIVDGCEAVGPLKMAGDVVVDPVRLDGGALRLEDRPGWGVTVDPDALKRYRVNPTHEEDPR